MQSLGEFAQEVFCEKGSLTIGMDGHSFTLKDKECITFSQISSGSYVEVQEITAGNFTTTVSGLLNGMCEITAARTKTTEIRNDYGNFTPVEDANGLIPPIPTPSVQTPLDTKPTPPVLSESPETPMEKVPQTGDDSHMGHWIGHAGLSLLGIAWETLRKKRTETQNGK